MSSRRIVLQRATGILFLQTSLEQPEWKVLQHACLHQQLSVSPVPYDEPFFARPDAECYIFLGSVEWEAAESISSLLDRVQSLLTASRHAARMLVYESAIDGVMPEYVQEARAYGADNLEHAITLLATPDGFWQWLEQAEQERSTQNVNVWLEAYLHTQGISEARLMTTDSTPTLHIQHTESSAKIRFQWIANLHHTFSDSGDHHERPVTIQEVLAVLPALPTTYSLLPPPPPVVGRSKKAIAPPHHTGRTARPRPYS